MLGALSVFHAENVTGRKAKGATCRCNAEQGATMRSGVDEARRDHIVRGHCRLYGDLKVWNAGEPSPLIRSIERSPTMQKRELYAVAGLFVASFIVVSILAGAVKNAGPPPPPSSAEQLSRCQEPCNISKDGKYLHFGRQFALRAYPAFSRSQNPCSASPHTHSCIW
jgi:hypothetical protein